MRNLLGDRCFPPLLPVRYTGADSWGRSPGSGFSGTQLSVTVSPECEGQQNEPPFFYGQITRACNAHKPEGFLDLLVRTQRETESGEHSV